ncbi:MAG: 50S ribosomal protein L36 [Tetrasphaera sp.]|nr:50S ribosomal protein L36 [Tetrasphaera sp.]
MRASIRSLKKVPGSQVVRRRGKTSVINRLNPRFKARQGDPPVRVHGRARQRPHDVGDVVIGDAVDHGMTRPLGMDQPAQTRTRRCWDTRGCGARCEPGAQRRRQVPSASWGEHDDPQGVTEGRGRGPPQCRRLIPYPCPGSQTGICRYSNPRILGALSTA